jgi:membrane protease YdiL (CAAX protease family)
MSRSLERALGARAFQLQLTSVAESWAWMRSDLLLRLGPFALVVLFVWLVWRPRWLGVGLGDLRAQLLFGVAGGAVLFLVAVYAQLPLSRRRGGLRVPADGSDAAVQAAYYALNGPLEEAFFRGLLQGGLAVMLSAPGGFLLATAAYVLYHRLGSWRWLDVLATVGAGVPLGLAFWLLPGPPSLLGVAIAHIAGTCGFLGPGPYLLRRLGLLRAR